MSEVALRQPSQEELTELERIYQPEHVGIHVLPNVADQNSRLALVRVLTQNEHHFRAYRYPLVSRWNFSEDDLKSHGPLNECRLWFTTLIRRLSAGIPMYRDCDTLVYSMLYAPGSPGIKPHRDSSDSVNVVAVFTLTGTNEFCVADTPRGKNERRFAVKPGDVTLIRGPIDSNANFALPLHYVQKVSEPRYVLICRQAMKTSSRTVGGK